MGGLSSMLGLSGGLNGSGQNVTNPYNTQDASTATQSSQQALQQQQAFLQATQAQNGLGNQTSVYNQMQGVANGTGPNPAQAALAQSTGANVANQAALMAGQRGSSANVGLMGRQAAMQGANIQQQAAGQGATMQANQSLNALNNMGSIANTQAAQQAAATTANSSATQGEQGQVLGAIANQNTAASGLAGKSMDQQAALMGSVAGGAGAAIGLAQGGKIPRFDDGGFVPYDPGSEPQTQAPAAAPAKGGGGGASEIMKLAPLLAADGTGIIGSPIYSAAGAASDPYAAERMQYGQGLAAPANQPDIMTQAGAQALNSQIPGAAQGPKSNVGKHFASNLTGSAATGNAIGYGLGKGFQAIGNMFKSSAPTKTNASPDNTPQTAPSSPMPTDDEGSSMAAKGGKVPAMVSPGEKYLDPKAVQKVKSGADPMSVGETIPGKPVVGGAKNDYANDIVSKDLDEGGLVLPRSVTQSKNPEWAAHQFVRAHMAKGGLVGKAPKKGKK